MSASRRASPSAFAKLVAGPHDADLDLGALINPKQKARVAGMVAAAEAGRHSGSGARLGASRTRHPAATISRRCCSARSDPMPPSRARKSLGRCCRCFPSNDEDEAIRLANGTDYGLVAGIWTKDGGRQHRVAKRVRAGQVFVNGYGAGGGIELPFGGFKRSGHGREKGFEALYDMSATKTIVFNHG